MNRNRIFAIFLLLAVAAAITAATNHVASGDTCVLTWSSVSPTSGDAVVKATSKANGAICGVALNGTATANEKVTVALNGIWLLPVTASSTVGNMVAGDYVYGSITDANTCTTVLSNINTGIKFGHILEGITASTTHGVLNTVKVLVTQPGHL